MDPNQQPTTPSQPMPQQSVTPPMPEQLHQEMPVYGSSESHGMRNFLLVVLALLVLIGVGSGAYYLGTKNTASVPMQVVPSITASPSAAVTTPTASPSPQLQTFTSGGVLTFLPYQISIPTGWVAKKSEVSSTSDRVTITQGQYQLSILQGALGGGACSYSDRPIAGGISQEYTNFVEIKATNGSVYRRGLVQATSGVEAGIAKYNVCYLHASDNTFITLTPYGVVTYTTPSNPEAAILSQMDAIVASLKTQ